MTKISSHPYGRKVVGEQDAARAQSKRTGPSGIYGRRVIGDPEEAPPKAASKASSKGRVVERLASDPVTPEDASMSLKELGALLQENPGDLDRLIDAEFLRPAPRSGAWRIFLQVETTREGGPRADVMTLLEQQLTGG